MKDGTYKARASDAALGYTLEGAPQVAVAFTILEGEHEGQSITWYGYFTEKSQRRTIDALRACGWKGDDLSDLTSVGDEDVSIVLKTEVYQGTSQVRVAWVNSRSGVQLKTRMTPEEAKHFAQQMMGHVVAARGPAKATPRNGSAPTTARTPTSPTGTDDDFAY